ncbi:CRACD-like protein [Hoplias malabaricus]|uniref:CRACD-like protein n=1 Tax=Hoplias malabaricus TaxID=27720 RepID=UPI003461D4F9
MESSGDREGGNSEDLTGTKKPKLQIKKSKLEKMKNTSVGMMKQSQSASDIIEGIRDVNDDFSCSQKRLGFRALSHDSIFLEEQKYTEPPRILSQENMHGKIRALQIKLQKQNIHLGPPPLLLPIKRTEDPGGSSEDDGLPHSPPEILGMPKNMPQKFLIPLRNHSSLSLGGTGSEEEEQSPLQSSSQPLSPCPINSNLAHVSPSAPGSGVDFSTPPQFIPCLDNSAARHRMSVKPRNQRASRKGRRLPISAGCRPRSESMNNLERPLTESEKEEEAALTKEMTRVRSYSSQIIRPGEVLSAPPIKSPLYASPIKPLIGATEVYPTPVMIQSEGRISPTNTSLQQHVLKQQTPTREAASIQKHESATTSLGFRHAPSSAVPAIKKWGGDLKESPLNSKPKSAQDSTVSSTSSTISSVESEQNLPQIKKKVFPQSSDVGVAQRPPSLQRNTYPIDNKTVSRNLQQNITAQYPGKEDSLQSADCQRPLYGSFRFPASSAKSHERQRAVSFTGGVDKSGTKAEPAPAFIASINLKTQDQPRSVQVKTAGQDPLSLIESQRNESKSSNLAVPRKLKDEMLTLTAARRQGDSWASEAQETGVEATEEDVQEAVEEADEAREDLKVNEANEEGKEQEERNAFGVKLRTTSLSLKFQADKAQSELKVKHHSAEVATQGSPLSASPEGQKDNGVGPIGGNMASTVSKESQIHSAEALISAQDSSSPPQSVSRDKEKNIAPIKLECLRTSAQPSPSLIKGTRLGGSPPKENTAVSLTPIDSRSVSLASKESTTVTLSTKELAQVCSEENIPIPTAVKQPQDASFELSWMSMAREKTRSLQQLFTSRLPEFVSLQTTTRSTNMGVPLPQKQTSSTQFSEGSTNLRYQLSATQTSVRPQHTTSIQPAASPASERATFSSQSPSMQSSIRPCMPSTGQSAGVAFPIKQTLTTTSQAQTTQFSVRTGQLPVVSSSATVKPGQSITAYTSGPESNTQKASLPETQTQVSTQSKLRSTQSTCLHLSSTPNFSPTQIFQDPVPLVSQPRPQRAEEVSSPCLGKANQTMVLQGKSPGEATSQWAGGPGSKALFAERWEKRTTDCKGEDQKATAESQPPLQSLASFRTTSSPKNFTESAASSVSMRLDREDKWQKKTVPSASPPSLSSSPLHPISDSGQPSWMELAKRKSLAWSDKAMD